MQIRQWTAISLLAAMGALVGCGAEEGGEPTAMDDTGYQRDAGDTAPAPDSSVARGPEGQEAQTGGELGARGDQRMTGDSGTADAGSQQQRTGGDLAGQTGQTGQAGQTGGETVGTTEFAALDTDSNGKLAESEWESDAVEGMEFSEIDEDSSGDIDRDEFRQAISATGRPSQSGMTGSEDESGTSP